MVDRRINYESCGTSMNLCLQTNTGPQIADFADLYNYFGLLLEGESVHLAMAQNWVQHHQFTSQMANMYEISP
jgi:hypothetical protein